MADFSENLGFGDSFDLSSTDTFIDHSELVTNDSINAISQRLNKHFQLSHDNIRLFFLIIATIIILICLIICISICICVCLNRRRNYQNEKSKGHRLLSIQSEKINTKKLSYPKLIHINGNQSSMKKKSIISSNSIAEKVSIKPAYYDYLDDIPFIDESRPSSYIEITRV